MSRDPVIDRIGERIRSARHHRNLSMQRLAAKIGLTYQQIQKYENGRDRISVSTLYRIAQVLDTDVAAFFEGIDGSELNVSSIDNEISRIAAAFERIPDPKVRACLRQLIDALAS